MSEGCPSLGPAAPAKSGGGRLQAALRAAADFLRGFVGLEAGGLGGRANCRHADHGERPTPAQIRAGLAVRAAGRRNCC